MHVQEGEGPLNSVPSFCREPGNPAKGQAGPAGSGGGGGPQLHLVMGCGSQQQERRQEAGLR